jgi:TRAP-type C4-dicarboxylate transport system permease small subunit
MSLQVFYRYFLADSLIWAEELCRYLLVWMSFLFIGAAFQRGEMIGFEFFVRRLPARIKAWVLAPGYLASAALLLVIAWYGWQFAQQNTSQALPAADFIWQSLSGRDSGISIFWVYISVPVGCLLLAAQLLARAVALLLETR